jgi:acyl-CoA thioesterase I
LPVRRFAPFSAVFAAILVLAGCEDEAPKPAEPRSAIEAPPEIPIMGPERTILAFGDSLLAGYRLEQGEGYPERLESALRANGVNARVTNAGVSGDTTQAGLQRLEFTLDAMEEKPELVIVSLGGNDMLRGLPPEQTRANLTAMVEKLRERGIKVLLLGMLAAPNLGKDYAAKFNPIYSDLANSKDVALVPFFLQPVIDKPDLMQKDRIHPTALGIEEMVAATLDDVKEALGEEVE